MARVKKREEDVDNYVRNLINRRDILGRHRSEMDSELQQVEARLKQEVLKREVDLRSKYNDPNYGGRVKIKASKNPRSAELIDGLQRMQEYAEQVKSAASIREETEIEVTSTPPPEITGINVDVLLKVVRASVNISDCFFEGTTKEQRQQLLSDIERADVRYG